MIDGDLPVGVETLITSLEAGEALSAEDRVTLAAVVRAVGEGRPALGIINGGARRERDAALQALRRAHFSGLPPSRAAKDMAAALHRYEVAGWRMDRSAPRPPRAGTLRRGLFDVLCAGTAPNWRTIERVFVTITRAVTNETCQNTTQEAEK